MKNFSRRDFIVALAASGIAGPVLAGGVQGRSASRSPAFLHGVASGDPLQNASSSGRASLQRG
jgi:alkaline phosphatase D